MAYRRMLLKDLIRNDHFIMLPHSSQCLYIHLLLEADDDGFVSSPLSVLRLTRTTVEDLKNLLDMEYILAFSSGVILIKNWCQHNRIRLEDCKYYCNQPATTCQPSGNHLRAQVRIV